MILICTCECVVGFMAYMDVLWYDRRWSTRSNVHPYTELEDLFAIHVKCCWGKENVPVSPNAPALMEFDRMEVLLTEVALLRANWRKLSASCRQSRPEYENVISYNKRFVSSDLSHIFIYAYICIHLHVYITPCPRPPQWRQHGFASRRRVLVRNSKKHTLIAASCVICSKKTKKKHTYKSKENFGKKYKKKNCFLCII